MKDVSKPIIIYSNPQFEKIDYAFMAKEEDDL